MRSKDLLTPDPVFFSTLKCSVYTREDFQLWHCLRLCSDCLWGPESKQTTELILAQKLCAMGSSVQKVNFPGWFCSPRAGSSQDKLFGPWRWCETSGIGIQLVHQTLNFHLYYFFNHHPSTITYVLKYVYLQNKPLLKHLGLVVFSCINECPARL